MARQKRQEAQRAIKSYTHDDKERLNNPPVGLVTPETDRDAGKKAYSYDPHLDPQLVWAGKAERTSFEVPTVSLHVHERIEPAAIIESVKKKNGDDGQLPLFGRSKENPPLRDAIDFYKHKHNWSNRLIAGDSLLVMNSLLEKEGMGGQVQMIYIDPPYGIRYGSNFQPFVNKRDVKDGKDEDLTAEPEMIRAFRDTWELSIHSYLSYLRDRLITARELLAESGSCFVQINDENVHLVRNVMDDVFGAKNFISTINVRKTGNKGEAYLDSVFDYILWYAVDRDLLKYREQLNAKQFGVGKGSGERYDQIEFLDGTTRSISVDEFRNPNLLQPLLERGARIFRLTSLVSESSGPSTTFEVEFEGKKYFRTNWKTNKEGFEKLVQHKRVASTGRSLNYRRYLDDFPAFSINNYWDDAGLSGKIYVVQTARNLIQRCLLMTTDPGDIVFDPTCGSGTTAYVAEQWGRRWITCDTSRVALSIAKQRLMTSVFDYYRLAHPEEGVGSGFIYKTVPHVTLKSIANNEPPATETLYDQPLLDKGKTRVCGPFTVEAVPAPVVQSLEEIEDADVAREADVSIARTGETRRQDDWCSELLKTGIRGKGGQYLEFSRVEPLPGTRWLHAEAETKEDTPKRAVISFGQEHAPLEQRQVALAIEEAQSLVPKPEVVVFAAFQFDAEAAKDIDETKWPGVTLLKAQMNADLLTEDLKKKRSSNESFWLIGQPDVEVTRIKSRSEKGKYQVSVNGFDYYNPKTGTIESGGRDKIAMWMLDTDYDGRSLLPRQVFLPMAGDKEGWSKLAKNLKAEIDPDLIEAYRSTESLPFEAGRHQRVAVKIVDDRGIESLKIIRLA